MTGEVPQKWKDATIKVLHKKKGLTACVNYRSLSFMEYTGQVPLGIVANRLRDFCRSRHFSQTTVRHPPQHSTIDTIFVVRRLYELGWTSNTSLDIPFIDLAKRIRLRRSCTTMGNTCPFWSFTTDDQGHRHLYDVMWARVQLVCTDFSAWVNVCHGLRQRCVMSTLFKEKPEHT